MSACVTRCRGTLGNRDCFACRVSGPCKYAVSLSLSGTRSGQPWPWGPPCASLWLIFSEVKLFSTCPMSLFSGKRHGRSCPRAGPASGLALRPAWTSLGSPALARDQCLCFQELEDRLACTLPLSQFFRIPTPSGDCPTQVPEPVSSHFSVPASLLRQK